MNIRSALCFVAHFSLQIINLGFWAILVFCLGLIKLLLPIKQVQCALLIIMHHAMFSFGKYSVGLIKLFNPVKLEYCVDGELSQDSWYLLIANHLSYLDIILLIEFAAYRIPAPKFFLKKELIWMPFVGIAAWALEMPFMRRYTRAFLVKYPHLKGKDIETTRRSCEKFKHQPTTIINFVEGTRFTQEKHQMKQSPYTMLLPPKAGGIAFTLAAMGHLFTHILDVSLAYPDNTEHPMIDMLCGNMQRIIVDVTLLQLPEEVGGDYFNDETYKQRFQSWLNQIWMTKDAKLQQLVNR